MQIRLLALLLGAALGCSAPVEPLDEVLDATRTVEVVGNVDLSAFLSSQGPGRIAVVLSASNTGSAAATVNVPGCSVVLLGYTDDDRSRPPEFRREAPGMDCSANDPLQLTIAPRSSSTLILTEYRPTDVFGEAGVTELWLRFRIEGERRSREVWLTESVPTRE